MSADHKTMKSVLKDPHSPLMTLIHQVAKLKLIDQQVNAYLPVPLKTKCQVTFYEEGQLRFIVTSGAVATQLRFLSSDLIEALRHKPGFRGIKEIGIHVASLSSLIESSESVKLAEKKRLEQLKGTPVTNEKGSSAALSLSKNAAQGFERLADALEPCALKDSLMRLIKHAKD